MGQRLESTAVAAITSSYAAHPRHHPRRGRRPSRRGAERRHELTTQLERLRDLYVMGDITKPQYAMRRQMMEEELQRAKPPTDPDVDRAQTILEDFSRFWDAEPEPAERRKLSRPLFAHAW